MGISKVIKKYKINEQPNDFSFWQSKSYEDCYKSRVQVEIQGLHLNFIDIENLKENKRKNNGVVFILDSFMVLFE